MKTSEATPTHTPVRSSVACEDRTGVCGDVM